MFAGDSTYSVAAESAAFKKLHNLNVAITQLKAQGNEYGVRQLLPYYRQALEEYRRSGYADPDYLTAGEEFILSLGRVAESAGGAVTEVVRGAGTVVERGTNKLLIAGALAVLGLYFWSKRR
jgi:hypothetical protein